MSYRDLMEEEDLRDLVHALHESPFLQFVVNSIPGPVAYLDDGYRYRFVNRAYDVLLPLIGVTEGREVMLGRTIDEFYGTARAEIIRPNIERALGGELQTLEVSFGGRQSLNSYIPHVVDGKVVGVLLISHDISELQASRDALIASERMASLGRLVAGLMHELNTPLSPVKSALELVERELTRVQSNGAADPERLAKLLPLVGAAREGADRMVDITRNLKRFAHVDETEARPTDVVEGLLSTLALMRPELEQVTVVEALEARPSVLCHGAEINQVFEALLSNAGSAMADGGTLTLRSRIEKGRLFVDVQDTGPGIEASRIASIFEPAFRNTGRRTKAGLGLFVSRTLALRQGGRLDVKSTVGVGSTFTLELPL